MKKSKAKMTLKKQKTNKNAHFLHFLMLKLRNLI